MTASKHDRTNAVLTHFARADLPTFPDFKTTPLAEDHELSGRAKAALRTHYINALRDASWSDFAFKPAPLARPPLTAAGGLTTTSHRPSPTSSNFVERRHARDQRKNRVKKDGDRPADQAHGGAARPQR